MDTGPAGLSCTPERVFHAVKDVSFTIDEGQTVALVGESGSGKSVTALSIMQLLPYPLASHPAGSSIKFNGEEVVGKKDSVMRHIRGSQIGMIFQEPMTALNPLHSIEKQIGEILRLHQKMSESQARKRVRHGLHASLTPLRFENGATAGVRRGRRYSCQQLIGASGQEMLYILRFYLPRFMDEDFEQKLSTVFHELWHISPDFDGDLRRHRGRCYMHTHSEAAYNARMKQFSRDWLDRRPSREIYQFLEKSFDQLEGDHGRVVAGRIPRPKLIPLDS